MNKEYNPLLLIAGIVIIFLLYDNGFLGSFITTCNNVEPDTTAEFNKVFLSMNITTSSAGPSLIYKETLIENNISVTRDVTIPGTDYGGYFVYDTNNCELIINYLLLTEEQRIKESFIPELIIPGYDNTKTYYDINHLPITGTPTVGLEYYDLVEESYVKMPVPYMTVAPTLKDNPYKIYTPVIYQTIKAKIINDEMYWCSNNGLTMITTKMPFYESLTRYGETVIKCETVYVNDTQKAIDECSVDDGTWSYDKSICECLDGSVHQPGITCPPEIITSSGYQTMTDETYTNSPGTVKNNNTNKIIGIIILLGLGAYILFFAVLKSKTRRKNRKV